MILGYNNQRVWCRSTEERILEAFCNGVSKKISIRDRIENKSDSVFNKTEYILWNTTLVKKFENDIYIYIASNMEEQDRYYTGYNYYPRREYIISNTTKSRLNAFLSYYGFNSLEVHSSMKDWSVRYDGEKLDVDSWYKLDLDNKRLIKE